MVKLMALSLFVTVLLLTVGVESFPLMNLYSYVQRDYNTHLYTYNASIIGYAVRGRVGFDRYMSEGILCLLDSDNSGKPFHHYENKENRLENLYTTNTSEVIGKNYKHKGIVGYCYPSQEPHTVPLYRYKKKIKIDGLSEITDHYYTTDPNKIGLVTPGTTGNNGYTYEGVACFVYNVKYHT